MGLGLNLSLGVGSQSLIAAPNTQPAARVLHPSSLVAGSMQSNTRVPFVNLTGRTIKELRVFYANWTYNASVEFSPTSTLAVRAGVEYPSGTRTALTTDGTTRDITIAGGAIGTILYVRNINIPSGATFWIRTKCVCSGGDGQMPRAYTGKSSFNGGTITSQVITPDGSDYTTVGDIPTNPSDNGYGPYGVCAYGTDAKAISFGIFGDSIARGQYGTLSSVYEEGIIADGYTFINFAVSGGQLNSAANNTPTRRLALAAATGCNHAIVGYGTNDIDIGNVALATMQTNATTMWTNLKSNGFKKIIQSTILPKTTDATSPGTVDTTPTGGFTGGASSRRSQYNAWLRGLTLGTSTTPDNIHELADVLESTRDSGLWLNPVTNTGDGTHPSNSGGATACTDLATKLNLWGY